LREYAGMRLHVLVIPFSLAMLSVPASAQQQRITTVPVAGATVLRLNVTGDVELVPDATIPGVQIRSLSAAGAAPVRISSVRTGKRLDLSFTGPARSLLPFTASGDAYRVSYPAGLPLDLRQFSGAVRIVEPAAAVQIYDADGSISVERPRGTVVAQADQGSVTVTAARAQIELTSGNGDVHASLAPDWRGSEIRLESTAGNLILTVPPGFQGRYDLATASGRVINPFRSIAGKPLVFMLTERGNVIVRMPAK
jgi:hypothetical protein